jgi:hypothetical protein
MLACVIAAALADLPGVLRPVQAAAETIEVLRAWIEPSAEPEAWSLSADVVVPMPGRLEEAVHRGVALHFVTEFELSRGRWYWWDERIAQASRTSRLAYHAITRQYRLTVNGQSQPFATLDEAVQALGMVRDWRVVDGDALKAGTTYDAQVRMRLDTGQLPKPFQVTAFTNRDWTLHAEWKHFTFNTETARSEQ